MNLQKIAGLFLVVFLTAVSSQALTWKGLFISGDDSIDNFDNGREAILAELTKIGSLDAIQLSSSRKFVSEQKNVFAATAQNIEIAFQQLKNKPAEACLIHMTSHGTKDKGFYLSKAGILSPKSFETLLDKACGTSPTVVLISACYSGQFITETIKNPNRIVLTAARADRPSFGCSADTVFTYWDDCVIQELAQSKNWSELYSNVKICITKKESALGAKPSEPQAFFGENTKEWDLLH